MGENDHFRCYNEPESLHEPSCADPNNCTCKHGIIHTSRIMTEQQILDKDMNRTLDNLRLMSIPPLVNNEGEASADGEVESGSASLDRLFMDAVVVGAPVEALEQINNIQKDSPSDSTGESG